MRSLEGLDEGTGEFIYWEDSESMTKLSCWCWMFRGTQDSRQSPDTCCMIP
jgi:hypothetical protein